MRFLTTVKPGEEGRVVLWTQALMTPEKASFDLKGIAAKSPVSLDLDKAGIAIDTSTASEDALTLTLKPVAGAVSQDLKIVGVAFDFDPAKLDSTKFALSWDGAGSRIQAKALDAAYSVTGVPVKAEVGFTFLGVDGQNWALSEDVDFTVTSGPGHPATVTVTATAGAGGTIAPNGAVTVTYGTDQTFTISPDVNHKIKDVKVNGASVGAVATHTMKNVTADGTIEATFESSSGGGGGGGGGCSAGYAFLALLGLLPLPLAVERKSPIRIDERTRGPRTRPLFSLAFVPLSPYRSAVCVLTSDGRQAIVRGCQIRLLYLYFLFKEVFLRWMSKVNSARPRSAAASWPRRLPI